MMESNRLDYQSQEKRLRWWEKPIPPSFIFIVVVGTFAILVLVPILLHLLGYEFMPVPD